MQKNDVYIKYGISLLYRGYATNRLTSKNTSVTCYDECDSTGLEAVKTRIHDNGGFLVN